MSRSLPLLALCLLVVGCASSTGSQSKNDILFGDSDPNSPALRDRDREFVGKPAPPPITTPTSMAELTAGPAGVSLGNPRSIEPKATTSNSTPTNNVTPTPVSYESPAAPVAKLTYEQLQGKLQARGVSWQQLQCLGNDSWHFICAIPDPANLNIRENYETTRPGAMGLHAIQAVIEEIDRVRLAAGIQPPRS